MADPTEAPNDMTDPEAGDRASRGDTAMTRSEEELVAATQAREVGRVRLRKRIVSEDVSVTVTLRKEVVEVEQESISDGKVDGTPIGSEHDDDYEMVLSEEEFVIEKRVVPKERLRLVRTVVTEHQSITDQVRKEQLEVDGDVVDPASRD